LIESRPDVAGGGGEGATGGVSLKVGCSGEKALVRRWGRGAEVNPYQWLLQCPAPLQSFFPTAPYFQKHI